MDPEWAQYQEELRQDAERLSRGEPCPACDKPNIAHLLVGEYWCDLYQRSDLVQFSCSYGRQNVGRAVRWHNAQKKLRTMIPDVDISRQTVENSRNNPGSDSRHAENEAHLKVVSEALAKKIKYFYTTTKTFAAPLIEEGLLEEEDLPGFLQLPLGNERRRREAKEKIEEEARMLGWVTEVTEDKPAKKTFWTIHELKAMVDSGDIPEEARGLVTFTKEKRRKRRKSAPRIKEEGADDDEGVPRPPTRAELEAAVAELYPDPNRRVIDPDASPWVFVAPGLPKWKVAGTP